MNYIIGIDIGGTNIDLVAVDKQAVILKKHKQIHQQDLNGSIILGIQKLIEHNLKPLDCIAIHLGTTVAINSLLEAKHLKKVGVLRLAAHQPEMPPAFLIPQILKEQIFAGVVDIHAGYEFDQRAMGAIDAQDVRFALDDLVSRGAEAFAIVGCFSPLYHDQENEVYQIIKDSRYGNFFTTLSHQLGGLGFLNRENNSILNSGLHQVLSNELLDLKDALLSLGFTVPIHITQNNGCLMSLDEALQFPIKTIASGPTNSLIGACKLADVRDAVVVDIGGTSTDIGVVENGFPRFAFESAIIANMPTDYMLPDIQVLALGGGSLIETHDNNYQIGPQSLGAALFEQAIICGGTKLCLHDVAYVEKMKISLNELSIAEASQIMQKVIATIQAHIQKIPRIHDYPILLVGGGAGLLPETNMQRLEHSDIANAYGAALAEVSATVDAIFELAHDRDGIMQALENEVIQRALKAGAQVDSIRIIQKELLPFYYMPNQLTRIVMTASGAKN